MQKDATHLQYRDKNGTAQVIPIGESVPKDATRVKRVVEVKTKTVQCGVLKKNGSLDGVNISIPEYHVDGDIDANIVDGYLVVKVNIEVDGEPTHDLIAKRRVPAGSKIEVIDGVDYVPV